jgi:hypothetical protein
MLSTEARYLYTFEYLRVILANFFYGFLLRKRLLIGYIYDFKLISIALFLKRNECCTFNALLDIAVVDMLDVKKGRFILNYLF